MVAASCWLYPAAAAAQATGAITGLVVDGSGGAAPGVTIEATNQGTGQSRTTVTSENGFYTIPLIGSPTFGQITGAEDGRIVQLEIKHAF